MWNKPIPLLILTSVLLFSLQNDVTSFVSFFIIQKANRIKSVLINYNNSEENIDPIWGLDSYDSFIWTK